MTLTLNERRSRRGGVLTLIGAWIWKRWRALVVLAVLAWIVILPLGYVVVGAFLSNVPSAPNSEFTLNKVKEVYTTSQYLRPLLNTVLLAAAVSSCATVVGGSLAWLYVRMRPYAAGVMRIGLVAPLFVSPFIGAVSWVTLYTPDSGLVNQVLTTLGLGQVDIFTVTGTWLVMTVVYVPYSFLFAVDQLERIGPELENAARVSGAKAALIVRKITIRLLAPALLSSTLLVFVLAAEMFSIPGLLAARGKFFTLSYVIYLRTTKYPLDLPAAAAAGTLLLLLTTAGVLLQRRLMGSADRFITVGGVSAGQRYKQKGPRTRAVVTGVFALYILVTVVGPLAALLLRSLLPFFGGRPDLGRLTFDNYYKALAEGDVQDAATNTMTITLGAIFVSMVLAGIIGYITVRENHGVSRVVNVVANLPIGVPGTVLAVGLVWAYIGGPIYGSLLIVALGIFPRWLPVSVRATQGAVMQTAPELGHAADICGSGPLRKIRRIFYPLYRGSLLNGAMLAGIFTFHEVTSSALLVTGETTTLPVILFNYMFDGDYGLASVVAVVQVALLCVVGALVAVFATGRRRRRERGMAASSTVGIQADMVTR